MKSRIAIKIISVVCAFVALLSTAGVYATWNYSQGRVESVSVTLDASLANFVWEGSEDLPKDITGENHQVLIQTILNGVTEDGVDIGLNNPDSYISTEISDRSSGWITSSTLGSMDFWERENIENYFNLKTDNLSFVLYFPEGVDDTYYFYTTSIELGAQNNPNIPIGEYVYPVYRTILRKNLDTGLYEAIKSEIGYAMSAYYSNPITGSLLIRYPSFSPTSWVAGNRGASTSDAVYTYLGQTQTAYLSTETTVRYYSIQSSSRATYAVTSENENCKISIYNNRNQLLASSNNVPSVQWSVSNNQTYYIAISGGASITFSVNSV